MKIKTADWLGAKFASSVSLLRLRTYNLMYSAANDRGGQAFTPDELKYRHQIVEQLCSLRNWQHYLFTDKARKLAMGIAIDREHFNYPMLANIQDRQFCYMPSPEVFIRWFRGNQGLIVLYMKAHRDKEEMERHTFHIDFELGLSSKYAVENWPQAEELLRLIVFTELTNPDLLFVEAGKKSTNDKAPLAQRVTNQTEIPLIRVHAHWNTVVINTSIIGVRGFKRLQACGKGRAERREIWIDPYTRKGYKRNAKVSA